MPMLDILAVLADEVGETRQVIAAAAEDLVHASAEPAFEEARDRCQEQIGRVGSAAEALGLGGLRQVCDHVLANLAGSVPGAVDDRCAAAIRAWPDLVIQYLQSPRDPVRCRALIEPLLDLGWPNALGQEAAVRLEQSLFEIGDAETQAEPVAVRQTLARPEDISVDLPEQVNEVLLDAFLTEGPLQTSHYMEVIQEVIRSQRVESLSEARRVIHALKGAANTVGVRGIAVVSHHLEDILEYLYENAVVPDSETARLMISVGDCLDGMFDAIMGADAPPAQALRTLQEVLDLANRVDRGDLKDASVSPVFADPVAVQAESGGESHGVVRGSDERATPEPAAAVEAVSARVERKARVPQKSLDEMLRISGEIAIGRSNIQERLQQSLKLIRDMRERTSALRRRAGELDALMTVQGVAANRRTAAEAVRSGAGETFDLLEMDQYSELHTTVQGLIEAISDSQILGDRVVDALSGVQVGLNQQSPLNNDLHDLLTRARMQPVATFESRLQRTVRQACDASKKSATLQIDGKDVVLDDQMVDLLMDPLQHLLRNAVDHGLEAPQTRVQLGKSETGVITLSFSRDGNYLLIRCRDDGGGLDLFRIHSVAVDRGLISEKENLTPAQLARLILHPGFSTKGQVTELSGRGVGMDIVNTNISRLKGTIDIQSEPGQGCAFVLRLPMSIGMAHCLLVRAAGQVYAIPSEGLDRVVFEGTQSIEQLGHERMFRDETDACSVHSLTALLDPAVSGRAEEDGALLPVVVMRSEKEKHAIVVDAVMSGRDLVIKSVGPYLQGIRGVIGVSILGDGRVVPILDIGGMLRTADVSTLPVVKTAVPEKRQQKSEHRVEVLVVDDSLSVRTALVQLLGGDGYSVRTARDGIEALEEIAKRRPSVMLVDMEMPRMNGLELLSRIRSGNSGVRIPVIMITSRSSSKHRDQALAAGADIYVTKPYREDDLLVQIQTMVADAA